MKSNSKAEHKGKKKDNLGWKIIKLQAQVGETNSRKAKKVLEAEKKKKEGVSTTTTGLEVSEEGTDLSEVAAKLLELKQQKISQKIYHAKKVIKKTFVKARTFETQRLIKRLNEARKAVEKQDDPVDETKPAPKKRQEYTKEDIVRFEHELELIKTMDMDALSEHAFASKLGKHPILGRHELLASYRVETRTTEKTNGSSNKDSVLIQSIESRLINTKTVKDYMTKLWSELEHIVSGKKADHQEHKKRRNTGDDHEEPQTKKAKTTQDDTSKREGNSDMSDSDDDDEDGGNNDVQYDSDSERDDGYDSDGLPLPKTGKNGKASTASSMFIGSLNEGHSQKKNKKEQIRKRDKNDWVDDKFDEIYGKAKKNRPGQRERRMKAERQFGQEANHIKKAAEEARQREEKKAARKAKQERFTARDASAANAQRPLSNRRAGAGQDSAPRGGQANLPHATTPVDPTLHPSWVAKQTEKAAIAAALTAAKSSKIVFDDDSD
ncbi:MAG: Bud-site selection protein [Benniella sp.]|nr:MAG: Bud-site selection protein [Benniella sp.]